MASTTVASVESYTSDSISPRPDNYAEFSDQTQVSLTLTDSNLWLVDTSQLAAQITDTSATVPLLDWTVKSQTTVSLDNIAADDRPISLATTSNSDFSQYLSSDRSLESMLQLSAVSGETQLNGSATGSGLSNSSSFTSGNPSASSSTTSFVSGGDGSSSSGSGFGSSTGTPISTTSKTSNPPTDGSDTPSGTPETPSISTSTSTDQTTPISPPNASSPSPVPVPFQLSPSLGLAVLITIWGSERIVRTWYSQLRSKHRT